MKDLSPLPAGLNAPETAPKDQYILADFGLDFPVHAFWNAPRKQWATAQTTATPDAKDLNDMQFANKFYDHSQLIGWAAVPVITGIAEEAA